VFLLNYPPPTSIYTLSLHDALPISSCRLHAPRGASTRTRCAQSARASSRRSGRRPHRALTAVRASMLEGACSRKPCATTRDRARSEEHTSELQSRENLVCRLLLEKK